MVLERMGDAGKRYDIAIVTPNLGLGGTQRVISLLAEAWARRGRNVVIVKLWAGVPDFYPLPDSVDVVTVKYGVVTRIRGGLRKQVAERPSSPRPIALRRPGKAIPLLSELLLPIRFAHLVAHSRRLRRAIERTGASTVVSFLTTANVLSLLALSRRSERLVICERNDPALQRIPLIPRLLRRTLYRRADLVTANTRGALESMRDYVPGDRLRYLPNPTRLPDLAGTNGTDDRKAVLAMGRLEWQKGFDVLVRACALLGTAPAPWKMVIVGSGAEEAALKDLAHELRIGDLIEWHDTTDDPDAYYRRASILVLPSRHEGTPNVLIEGMGHGVAPIVTDASPGPLELVDDGVSGLVIPSEAPEALASAIRRLMTDNALRRRLAAAAQARVAPFSLDNVLSDWEAALMLDRHRSEPVAPADGCQATTVVPP